MNEYLRSFNKDFDIITTVYGERPALIPAADGQAALNYSQLNDVVYRHLAWLKQLRLEPGDRIGAVMPNSVEMLALFIACLRGGYGFAPLACDTSAPEAEKWVRLVRPACVMVSPLLADPVRAGLLQTGVRCMEVDAGGDFAYLPATAKGVDSVNGAKLFLFTSGTTGQPKALILDADRLWSAGYAFLRQHGLSFDTSFRIWNYLPQSYLGGLFNLCLAPMAVAGATVVDEGFSGKTFLSFWQSVDRFDINALWLVPTIVRGLLAIGERTRRYQSKSYRDVIKIAFLGTAPIDLAAKRRFEELFGTSLLENYALSETTFLTTEKVHDLVKRHEGSVGPPLPYAEFKFRPMSDDPDPAYQEILVSTPFLYDGYLELDGTISAPPAGVVATGDLGYLDAEGQVVITGRSKDIIKKGGQLVSLREVEVAAYGHPAVKDAAATAVPHPFYGESFALFIQLAPAASPADADDVRRHVYDSVAKYKWPDQIKFVETFDRTGSGKIRKFLLKG